jgi:hypothetical protein
MHAWVSVALIPIFFFLALAAGEGLYSLLGYDPGSDEAPLRVDLLCGSLALVLFVAPCVAAVLHGRRAHRAGERRAMLPLVIGAAAGLYFVVLTVVTLAADALG